MTHMLPRDRAELIVAEYAAGKPVRVIAEAYGHSITTVRDYARGQTHPRRARSPGRRLRLFHRLLPAAPGRRPAPANARPADRAFPPGPGHLKGNVLPRPGALRHPDAPMPRLSSREHERILAAGRGPEPAAVTAAGASRADGRGNPGIVHRPPRRRQPHHPRGPARHLPPWFRIKARWHDDRWQPGHLMTWADDAAARLALISGTTATAIKNTHSRLRQPRRPARPGLNRLPPLHGRPPHPGPSPGAPARAPPGLHQARHLAVQGGNTTIQRQRMPRHHGRRAAGTQAPPALHHRTAHLRQDPGRATTRQSRPARFPAGMETADARTHHVKPATGHRIMPAGTVHGSGLPRNRRHGRCNDHPAGNRRCEQQPSRHPYGG